MDNTLTTTEQNRYVGVFIDKLSLIQKKDVGSKILKKILKYELKDLPRNFTVEDFIKHIYYDRAFEKQVKELITAIEENDYVYVHSYGKNGKSTFVAVFLNEINKKTDYIPYLYDFQYKADKDNDNRFLNLAEGYYLDFLYAHKSTSFEKHPFISFFRFIIDNCDEEYINKLNNPSIKHELFNLPEMAKKILSVDEKYVESSKAEYGKQFISIEPKPFLKILITLLLEKNNRFFEPEFDSRKSKELGYDLFNLLIAVKIFYAAKYQNKSKVLFFFDNLDDVHTYMPEKVSLSYVANVISYIEYVKDTFTGVFSDSVNNSYIEPSFIFIYRTSNYLSTIAANHNINGSERSRIKVLENISVSKIRLSSVKHSFDILKKRIYFYRALCDSFAIAPSDKSILLESLLETFDKLDKTYKSNFDPATILRLWNGNKLSFVDFALQVNFSSKEIELLKGKCSNRIKAEIFFHHFIKKSYFEVNEGSPISKFLLYSFSSFDSELVDERCSLSRLFFTYVYNYRIKDKEVKNVQDTINKGISLKSFMQDINELKIGDEQAYSKEDIEKMFTSLFSFEIDNWGNFFCCCAPSQGINDNSSNEYYKWVTNINHAIKDGKSGGKIGFYYNDSAPYFMFKVKRSFEYFSFSTDRTSDSLPNLISYSLLKKTAQRSYLVLLEKVFTRVRDLCIITFDFFEKAFPETSMISFTNGVWSYNKKMYFEDVISKIIEYLEDIRFSILEGMIPIGGNYDDLNADQQKEALKTINLDFTKNILDYLKLFSELYDRSMVREEGFGKDLPKSLKGTFKSFKRLKESYENILENPTDFKFKIKSNE